ncbi:uncharacterized protein LOC135464126 [Liolophura sinensis]|uniref:uncharacterized protein LOC135464126 n=1 Tax=Liolophura sinensis TaxID=3198878 RepID=UPI003157FFB9
MSISGTILDIDARYVRSELNVYITGNQFMDIARGRAVEVRTSIRSSINIANNLFENITDPRANALVEIYQHVINATVRVENNTFQANGVSSMVYLSGESGTFPYTYITSNTFLNNSVSNTILSAISGFQARNNIFTNPRASCEIKAPDFNDFAPIDALNCYWGFGDLDKIVQRVCSFEKDMRLSRVNFIPYLLSADLGNKVDITDGTFHLDTLIGGVVTGTITLAKGPEPVVISRSVYVEENAVLVIEAGSTVEFEEDCGIFVKGKVVIGSDKASRTTLQPHNSDFWEGIVFGSGSLSKSRSVTSVSEMRNTHILNPRTGVRFLTSQVSLFNNVISGSGNAGITLDVQNTVFDFNGTAVIDSGSYGLYGDPITDIRIRNVTIIGSNYDGVALRSAGGHVELEYVTLDGNSGAGVEVTYSNNDLENFFTMSHSQVLNNQGVAVQGEFFMFYRDIGININNNNFTNNTRGGLLVTLSESYGWRIRNPRLCTCNITDNVFTNSGTSSVRVQSYAVIDINNNQFLNSHSLDACILSIESSAWINEPPSQVISLTTNRFEMGSGECAVGLSSQDEGNLEGLFVYNQLTSFDATEATIIVDSLHFNVTDNILDNPESVYEIKWSGRVR